MSIYHAICRFVDGRPVVIDMQALVGGHDVTMPAIFTSEEIALEVLFDMECSGYAKQFCIKKFDQMEGMIVHD